MSDPAQSPILETAAAATAEKPITYNEVFDILTIAAERIAIVQKGLVEAGREALAAGGIEAVRAGGHILEPWPRAVREQKALAIAARTFARIIGDRELRERLKEISDQESAALRKSRRKGGSS